MPTSVSLSPRPQGPPCPAPGGLAPCGGDGAAVTTRTPQCPLRHPPDPPPCTARLLVPLPEPNLSPVAAEMGRAGGVPRPVGHSAAPNQGWLLPHPHRPPSLVPPTPRMLRPWGTTVRWPPAASWPGRLFPRDSCGSSAGSPPASAAAATPRPAAPRWPGCRRTDATVRGACSTARLPTVLAAPGVGAVPFSPDPTPDPIPTGQDPVAMMLPKTKPGACLSQPTHVMSLEDSAPARSWLSKKGKPAAAQQKMLVPLGTLLGSVPVSPGGVGPVWGGTQTLTHAPDGSPAGRSEPGRGMAGQGTAGWGTVFRGMAGGWPGPWPCWRGGHRRWRNSCLLPPSPCELGGAENSEQRLAAWDMGLSPSQERPGGAEPAGRRHPQASTPRGLGEHHKPDPLPPAETGPPQISLPGDTSLPETLPTHCRHRRVLARCPRCLARGCWGAGGPPPCHPACPRGRCSSVLSRREAGSLLSSVEDRGLQGWGWRVPASQGSWGRDG